MHRFRPFFLAALLVVSLPTFSWANDTTYYVDNAAGHNGSDGNAGTTDGAPFLTFSKCLNTATLPGDTCLIKNGTYTENGTHKITWSGTSTHPITLKNYPGHTPVLRSSDWTNPVNQMIAFEPTPYPSGPIPSFVVIEGLTITNVYYAIHLSYAHDLTIRGNHFHHTIRTAIVGDAYNTAIDSNQIHDVADKTAALTVTGALQYAIYISGKNNKIINNLIYDTGAYCVQFDGGLDASAPSTNFAGQLNMLFANNTCAYTWYAGGVVLWGGGGTASTVADNTGVRIFNNIFFQNCIDRTRGACTSGSTSVDGDGPIRFLGFFTNALVQITNNVAYDTLCPSGTCFIVNSGPGWYTASGNFTTLNPNMTNAPATTTVPTSPDFSLTAASLAAIGTGLNLSSSFTRDYLGLTRTVPWDIGAYKASTTDTTAPSAPTGVTIQ